MPDVEIPDIPITELVLRRADELADQPAISDVASGRGYTFGELKNMIRSFAGGLAGARVRPGRHAGDHGAQPARVRRGLPRRGASPAAPTPRSTPPTPPTRSAISSRTPKATILVTIEMFLETARAAIEGTDVTEIVTIDGVEGTTPLTELFGDPIDQVAGRRRRPRRRAAVLVGHHRPARRA